MCRFANLLIISYEKISDSSAGKPRVKYGFIGVWTGHEGTYYFADQ